jgi:hypothetical protein
MRNFDWLSFTPPSGRLLRSFRTFNQKRQMKKEGKKKMKSLDRWLPTRCRPSHDDVTLKYN